MYNRSPGVEGLFCVCLQHYFDVRTSFCPKQGDLVLTIRPVEMEAFSFTDTIYLEYFFVLPCLHHAYVSMYRGWIGVELLYLLWWSEALEVAMSSTEWYWKKCAPCRKQHHNQFFQAENTGILISQKFARKGPINNTSAMVQIIAWRRTGDKPFSGPMMALFTDAYMRQPTSLC